MFRMKPSSLSQRLQNCVSSAPILVSIHATFFILNQHHLLRCLLYLGYAISLSTPPPSCPPRSRLSGASVFAWRGYFFFVVFHINQPLRNLHSGSSCAACFTSSVLIAAWKTLHLCTSSRRAGAQPVVNQPEVKRSIRSGGQATQCLVIIFLRGHFLAFISHIR